MSVPADIAIFSAATMGRIKWFIHRQHNVGDRNLACDTRQQIASAGAPHTIDQFMPTQSTEELFKVGQRYILSLTYSGQRDGPAVLAQPQINHGGDGKTAACG